MIKRLLKEAICLRNKIYAKKTDREVVDKFEHWEKISKEYMRYVRFNQPEYSMRIFYNLADLRDPSELQYMISDQLYKTKFLPVLNRANYTNVNSAIYYGYFLDKNYQNLFINNMISPKVIARIIDGEIYDEHFNLLSLSDLEQILLCQRDGQLVFKKSYGTGHGKGVALVRSENYSKALKSMGKNIIIQSILKQHRSFAKWNQSSVNIVRITTLFWKGTIYILGAVFRIGAPGGFCDHLMNGSESPLVIPLDSNGNFISKAIDFDQGYVLHNIRGNEIKGQIKRFVEMKRLVCEAHKKFPYNRMIGWDLTLDEEENIVLMEYNADCPGIIQSQCALGPIFNFKLDNGKSFIDEIMKGKH